MINNDSSSLGASCFFKFIEFKILSFKIYPLTNILFSYFVAIPFTLSVDSIIFFTIGNKNLFALPIIKLFS